MMKCCTDGSVYIYDDRCDYESWTCIYWLLYTYICYVCIYICTAHRFRSNSSICSWIAPTVTSTNMICIMWSPIEADGVSPPLGICPVTYCCYLHIITQIAPTVAYARWKSWTSIPKNDLH